MAATRKADYCAELFSLYAGKKKDVHFVWATNYICSGRIFSKRGFYSPGASIVAVNRKDSKIVW